MSVGEMSVGEMSVGEVSVGEMSVGEMSGYRYLDIWVQSILVTKWCVCTTFPHSIILALAL